MLINGRQNFSPQSPALVTRTGSGRPCAASSTSEVVSVAAVRSGDVDRQRRSGASPHDRDPQLLGQSVDRLVAERGWQAQAAVGGVVARWPHVVGPELADHCVPEGYAETVLTVRADSTAWATQVRLLAPSLVARLNAECGEGTVTQVRVLGPGRPSWRKGHLHVRGRGPRDTYG